jgi:phosphoribosylglycinamide formyltransferase-1
MTPSPPRKAVILISGSGSNLQAFIDQIEQQQLPIQIDKVICNNQEAFGLVRAQRAGLKTAYIDHRKFPSRVEFDQALIDEIDLTLPDMVILAGFMRILTADFVNHYVQRLINIHPSLLPKYPGNNTHQRALDAGEKWHGVSIHFVVPEVDAGPVILQGQLLLRADDTPSSLQQRLHLIEHQLYPKAISWIAQGRVTVKAGKVYLDNERSPEQLQSFDL